MRDLGHMLEWEQPPPEPVLDADGVPLPDQPPPPGPQYDEETGAELPPELPERDPTEWVRAYVQYVQIFRRLERAYDQMSHPQKRVEVKRTLEATIGRCLELRHWVLKKFGRELEHVSLDETLEDMNLPVDAMEIPVPRYFVDDRRHELGARDTFLEALLHKFETAKPELGKPNVFVGRVNWTKPVPEYMTRDVFAPPPLSQEEAEAKRIEDERIAEEYRSDLEERVNILAATKTKDQIATVIQKYARGWLARREYERLMDEELVFLGMRPAPRPEDPRDDPILRDMANNQMRKKAQYANQDEYLAAYENLKDRVKERHGQEMREEVQDKINAWFLENRDPETGAFPDFPDVGNGGSADILNPPPKEDDDADLDPKAAKAKADAEKKKKAEEEKKKKEAAKKKGKGDDKPKPKCPAKFINPIRDAIDSFDRTWSKVHDTGLKGGNFEQRFISSVVEEELKPVVFEEVRREVDEEMRLLLENLREMVEAERAAKAGPAKKGKGAKGKKGGKGDGKKKEKKEKGGGGAKAGGKKGKGKDLTADRTIESLYAELVELGIVQPVPPEHTLDAYAGDINVLGSTLERNKYFPDPSMAQVRQMVTELAILPLGASGETVHSTIPGHCKTLLLYGCKDTGKTALAHAIANHTGAVFFNLSPRNTDGKYPGKKETTLMIHMVFKVARTMQPAVIYVDELEKVFLSDKKKLREYKSKELFSRVKKDLLKETKGMKKGERVMIVGCSSEPYLCVKKDQRGFMKEVSRFVYCPVPDDTSRRVVWERCVERRVAETVAAGLVWPEPKAAEDAADAAAAPEAETQAADDTEPAAEPAEGETPAEPATEATPETPPAEGGGDTDAAPEGETEPVADAEGGETATATEPGGGILEDDVEDPDAEPEIVRPYSLPRDFDMSMLCACTVGYPSGAIDMACRAVLTPQRVARLVKAGEELTVDELLDKIQLLDKATEMDEAKMKDWTSKLPARVKLEKALNKEEAGDEEEEKPKKKK